MARRVSDGQLIIPNENLGIHQKKPFVDGKATKSTFATSTMKKGGVAGRTRKALNDITNKSTIIHEASSKKAALPKEEFNVGEERFLHDHKKCIDAQQNALDAFQLELVLPGIDFSCKAEKSESKQTKGDHDLESPYYYPEPVELPISEFSDLLESSTRWISPPCSPLYLDSPPSSPFAWRFAPNNIKDINGKNTPSKFLSESSFSLYYHGGKIMTKPVTVSLLWVGTGWKGPGREAIQSALTSLTSSRYHLDKDSEVPTLGNWWEIVRQYGDGDNVPVTDRVDLGPECFYNGPELNMTRDQVIGIVQSAFNKTSREVFKSLNYLNCTRPFKVNENGIYHVVFSYHVKFFEGMEEKEFMDTCSGKFTAEVSAGVMVNMLWERAPQDADDICSELLRGKSSLGPPNGDEKIDSLVGYVLGNTAEEVINGDGRGWFSDDGSRMTVTNSCASLIWRGMDGPPLFRDIKRNVSFNAVGLNGYRYTVPYVWDQKIMNCALKPSVTCGSSVVTLKQPKGYLSAGIIVNHSNGLQPYPPNHKCAWKINNPGAKFISFEVMYMPITADSAYQILICRSVSDPKCSVMHSNCVRLKLASSKSYIMFKTGGQVSLEMRGWEFRYSVGFCNGRKDVFDHKGSIGYASSPGLTYVEGLTCNWVLHGKPGTPVSISFTHINISENLDFLAVYIGSGTKHQVANFTGVYSVSDLPRMNLSGVVTIAFSTQTDKGEGWSANFYISSPVMPDQNPIILVPMLVFIAAMICLAFVIIAQLNKNGKYIIGRGSDERHMLISLGTIREENRIGEGPSAIVYRAASNDGGFIALKWLRNIAAHTELEQEILLECSSHSRIVSLIGHAKIGLGRHVLLFEFMGRRDLAWNLKENGETLNWNQRLAIALQICSAIQMLHMYLKPPVYHGNITSENVLLDEFCNAKLGGFGVAKYCSSRENPGQQPSEMAEDIRSFGLLLVELLTGDTQVDKQSYKALRGFGEVNELMGNDFLDRRLEIPNENNKVMALTKLGEIAKWCIGGSCRVEGTKNNPKIGDVLSGLTQVKRLFCSVSG
ncbi:hypothetical protein FNV43_RR04749 [Rhamnella rubrinervis]|uniref:Protein kinase domain-containing protein n=1 Tax=Rhamnella rubrinervis TaxID=2594499 RepID=A0A8K0HKC7_9ROSA|nr:hypothetical protein FNV43_RR04749 [Rhamnella rubrinervis]